MNDFIPVNEPCLNGNEKKYLNECIDTGWISSEGPFVRKFEENFATYVNREYGIAVANGSGALDIAVAALQITAGDEVIMPAFTIISCAQSIVRAGAIPVLVDVDKNTWNMDVSKIEAKITKRTKAIMVVHIYGLPVDMELIINLANKYNLKVIEDAAQAIGQTYKGEMCGSFGDISTFSFYPNKHITTGEGGMVVTNSPELACRCQSLRNLCFKKEQRFFHEELGWNYRMSNLQAAVGLAQFEQLEKSIIRKREIGEKYQQELSDLQELVQLPVKKMDYANNIYWVFGLVLKEELGIKAKEVMLQLAQNKIGTRAFFWPMHRQPIFNKMGLFENESYPTSECIANYGFYLPSGLGITDSQIEKVAATLKEILS